MRRLHWVVCLVLAGCATAPPAQHPPLVEITGGPTLVDHAPQSSVDVTPQRGYVDFATNVLTLTVPLAGGVNYAVTFKTPNPGLAYELGGNATGECDVQGKTTKMEGVVRLDEWTKGDGIVQAELDVWCTPDGFDGPRRMRATFTQRASRQTIEQVE
jgi:hypothetical protein